jgi:hypothetical protein
MKKKYLILISIALTVWLAENIYFGWNFTARNDAEQFWDNLSTVLFLWAIVGDILNGVTVTKNVYIENQHDHMQSDKLFLEIKKGATLVFGDTKAISKKDISVPLTKGISKENTE